MDRLPVAVSAAPAGRVQRSFSVEAASNLVRSNTPAVDQVDAWPWGPAPDLWTWFRGLNGVTALIDQHPRWAGDVPGQPESRQRMVDALEGLYQRVQDERERQAQALVLELAPSVDDVDAWPQPNANLVNWFRTRPGAAVRLQHHPNLARIQAIVQGLFQQVLDERQRRAELQRQQQAQQRADAVPQTLLNHVFLGDFAVNGNPTGYHSTIGNSPTHQAYGATTAVGALGVYQRSVRGRPDAEQAWRRKPIQSTFFPDAVGGQATTENDVKLALGTGMASAHKRVQYPVAWRDMTLKKIGDTWFPDGGVDRAAEPLP